MIAKKQMTIQRCAAKPVLAPSRVGRKALVVQAATDRNSPIQVWCYFSPIPLLHREYIKNIQGNPDNRVFGRVSLHSWDTACAQ